MNRDARHVQPQSTLKGLDVSKVNKKLYVTYNSDGDGQNPEVGNRQNSLFPVLEISPLVHVEPEDCREADFVKLVFVQTAR